MCTQPNVIEALREAEAALELAIKRILKRDPGHHVEVTSEAKALVSVRQALQCQGCDVPKDGVYQISEPSHSMSMYASKDDMLRAVMAENEQLKAQLAAAQQPVEVTDDMALAFHQALTDGALGADELEDIKTGLRAALAAAPQPPEAACNPSMQPELATNAAPVQMPEPAAVAFRFETEENGPTETSFYPSDRIGMGWTALYTEHQVRQLLAAHGIGKDKA